MTPTVRSAFQTALDHARSARARGDLEAAFAALERAHILGQRYLIPHIVAHLHMLRIGWQRRDARELLGQVIRLIATVPGYLTGWVPKGNPGGSNISAVRPMPVSGDLAELLKDFHVWRDVAKRVLVYAVLALASVVALVGIDARRAAAAAELEEAWKASAPPSVADFGTTSSLEVVPIVNWRARAGLQSEPGVAYLIRTDRYTVLFDLGFNRDNVSPSPLEQNLTTLGVRLEDIDAIFVSHAHRDHLGGARWEREKSFSLGVEQPPLPPGMRVLAPVALTYPGTDVQVANQAGPWLPGLATTGPIPRQLLLGRIDEQALLIHVEGRGLVAIVGCGHQTIPKLLTHIRSAFAPPLIGLIGDVHYPVPEGRLFMAGIDVQYRLASGDGPWRPLSREQVESELDTLSAQLEILGLGSHDTSDEVLAMAADRFGDRFRAVTAGEPIVVQPSATMGSRHTAAQDDLASAVR